MPTCRSKAVEINRESGVLGQIDNFIDAGHEMSAVSAMLEAFCFWSFQTNGSISQRIAEEFCVTITNKQSANWPALLYQATHFKWKMGQSEEIEPSGCWAHITPVYRRTYRFIAFSSPQHVFLLWTEAAGSPTTQQCIGQSSNESIPPFGCLHITTMIVGRHFPFAVDSPIVWLGKQRIFSSGQTDLVMFGWLTLNNSPNINSAAK